MNLGNQYGEYAIESGQTMRCKRPSKATASAASRLQSSTPQCNGATARVEKARSSSCFWLHCNMDRVGPVHLGHSSDDAALRIKIASPGAMLFGNVSCAKQVSAEALGYYSDVRAAAVESYGGSIRPRHRFHAQALLLIEQHLQSARRGGALRDSWQPSCFSTVTISPSRFF